MYDLFRKILQDVTCQNYQFHVRADGDRVYLQIACQATDAVTGAPVEWTSRKWLLSPHMTRSEVVQTAFKAVLTAVEHEIRETFKYRGKAIFGPHFDVDKLVLLCETPSALDVRAAV